MCYTKSIFNISLRGCVQYWSCLLCYPCYLKPKGNQSFESSKYEYLTEGEVKIVLFSATSRTPLSWWEIKRLYRSVLMMLFQKPFLHRISPTYFFSLNAVLAFLDCIHFIVKLKRVFAWTGKRERGMTR